MLFLDELPEFERGVLESLRQVLEDGQVVVARARGSCVFPARFQLVAAANPCPCGWRGSDRDCRCDDGALHRYAARVSGPLLDRIDLHLNLPAVRWEELDGPGAGPASAEVRRHVAEAKRRQARREAGGSNAQLPDTAVEEAARCTPEARRLLGRAVERFGLTARGARRCQRVARTIADLSGEDRVDVEAMAEALSFRDPRP